MMKVVVDLERLKFRQCGLGQFSLHLGQSLLEQRAPDVELVFLVPPGETSFISSPDVRTLTAAPWRKQALAGWLTPFVSVFPRAASQTVWHVTHQDSKYLPLDRRVPLVLTIHDLNFLREKPPAVIRRRLRRLQQKVQRATVLTTGSQYAAQEIGEHLDVCGKEIRVIPHGVCLDRSVAPARPPAVSPDQPFLFTIGDITPKKNFHVLVDMLAHLPAYTLVIAGAKSHSYVQTIERRVSECSLHQRVVMPGRVSEAERNWLYQHCTAFVFPSLTEGFGLPLIEAMSYGRPIFSSRNTSLPEVGGPLAFYWDTFEPANMAEVFRRGMQTFAGDLLYAAKLKQRAETFRWPDAARRYSDLYREVAESRRPKQIAA